MGILNKKFTFPGSFVGHRVVDLPDSPSQARMDAQTLKAKFDDAGMNVIAQRVNDIIDALLVTTADDSGAHNVGSATIAGVNGSTVAAQLASLQQNIVDAQAGQVLPGTVDDTKLNRNSPNLYARFDSHTASLNAHFMIAQTAGTQSAFTLTDGVSTWANLSTAPCLFLVRPHVTSAANATMAICGGPALPITPSAAGGLQAGQMKANGVYLMMWEPATSLLYVLNPEPFSPFIYSPAMPTVVNGMIWLKPL